MGLILPINRPTLGLRLEQVDVIVEARGSEPIEEGLAVGAHFVDEGLKLRLGGSIGFSLLVWPGRNRATLDLANAGNGADESWFSCW